MKSFFVIPFALALSLLVVGGGCSSSPKSRIDKNRATFDAYSEDVRAAIRAGEVQVGFTAEQVNLALGKPDRVLTQTTAEGASEVWVYRKNNPRLGLGLGFGAGSGPVGAGVGVSSRGREFSDERMRVTLAAGRVTSVQQISK